jgi:uncharacterized protein
MSRVVRCTFWAACLLLAAPSFAAKVHDLYEALVPVSGRDQAAYREALGQALTQVALRVSGRGDAAARLALKPGEAERLVQQSGYREGEGGAILLWVRFEPQAVDDALRARGLPVWGTERPAVLLWLAIEDQGRRFLVGADERPDVQAAVSAAARRRGLPLFLPLLDLEDQARVQAADVWAGFGDAVQAASARYHADAVLLGRIAPVTAGHWGGDWMLEAGGTGAQWRTEGSLTELIDAAVDRAADALAARYALGAAEAGEGGEGTLRVSGISNVQEYAHVLSYIASLAPVRRVEPQIVQPESVTFHVDLKAGRGDLEHEIALGQVLEPLPATGGGPREYGLVR